VAQTGESLTVRVRNVNDVTVVDLSGRLIMGEAIEAVTVQVRDLLGAGTKNLAINLADLTYVDSSGIACLVDLGVQTQKAGGACKFFAAHKRVIQLLRIARIDTKLVFLADESSALASF
jgi:anti-sigma B factor antagonist